MAEIPRTDQPTLTIRLRLEELAAQAGVGVDTIRYYQSRGLLDRPVREGRIGWYGVGHLERLERVRDLSAQGFTLAQITDLVERTAVRDSLLVELADRSTAEPGLDRTALAERSGMAPDLIDLAIDAGLLAPISVDDELFSADAVDMLSAGRELLNAGLPLDDLAALAVGHAQHVEELVDRAIELVRGHASDAGLDRDQLAAEVQRLVPAVTVLVARHFERTLLARALERVEGDLR